LDAARRGWLAVKSVQMHSRGPHPSGHAVMPRRSKAELATPHLVDDDYSIEAPPAPPPPHLSEATKAWWTEVCGEYVLKSHHLRILECACDAWDRMTEAREALSREGLIGSTGAGGPKANPAAVIERDSRAAFLYALRELDLDSEPKPGAKQPPPIFSNRR
jgi:P27 family predicted phage terminase small subunit